MSETIDRALEHTGIKFPLPKIEETPLNTGLMIQYNNKLVLDNGDIQLPELDSNNVVVKDNKGTVQYFPAMTEVEFWTTIYEENRDFLDKQIKAFEKIKNEYRDQVEAIKKKLEDATEKSRNDLKTQIKFDEDISKAELNYDEQYRNKPFLPAAKTSRRAISQLKSERPSVPKIGTYYTFSFQKIKYDYGSVKRSAITGNPSDLTRSETTETLRGEDFIDYYNREIEFIDARYIMPYTVVVTRSEMDGLAYKFAQNKHWIDEQIK